MFSFLSPKSRKINVMAVTHARGSKPTQTREEETANKLRHICSICLIGLLQRPALNSKLTTSTVGKRHCFQFEFKTAVGNYSVNNWRVCRWDQHVLCERGAGYSWRAAASVFKHLQPRKWMEGCIHTLSRWAKITVCVSERESYIIEMCGVEMKSIGAETYAHLGSAPYHSHANSRWPNSTAPRGYLFSLTWRRLKRPENKLKHEPCYQQCH